jgi:hypothetical protein
MRVSFLPISISTHAQTHLTHLVPTLDDLSLANVEGEGLAAIVGCIELGSVGVEGTAVVDVDLVACDCQYAFMWLFV